MDTALVPPKGSCIVKCSKCKGMYIPKCINAPFYGTCPFCGWERNGVDQTIPVWKYNLIKFFRSGIHVEDIENKMISFNEKKEDNSETDWMIKEINSLQKRINDLEKPTEHKKEPETKQTKMKFEKKILPPKLGDYIAKLKINYNSSQNIYLFYGIVDSMADLPDPKRMPCASAAYYVEAKAKFVTIAGSLWNLDNELDSMIQGDRRKSFLKELYVRQLS